MSAWPPSSAPLVAPIDGSPSYPSRTFVQGNEALTPAPENTLAHTAETRSDALRALCNALVALSNVLSQHFLLRDGKAVGAYMRDRLNLNGHKVINVAEGTDAADAVVMLQTVPITTVIADINLLVAQSAIVTLANPATTMKADLDMTDHLIRDSAPAAASNHGARKDYVDLNLDNYTFLFMPVLGTAPMYGKLRFEGGVWVIRNLPPADASYDPSAAASTYELTALDQSNTTAKLPVGSIVPFAGATPPDGWILCDGRRLHKGSAPNLHNLLVASFAAAGQLNAGQNFWGVVSTDTEYFYLPDLRGRVPVCIERPNAQSSPGLASGTFSYPNIQFLLIPGQKFGVEQLTLSLAQIAGHAHSLDDAISGNVSAAGAFSGWGGGITQTARDTLLTHSVHTTNNTGNGDPHNNVQPAIVLNWIIKESAE